MSLKLSYSDGSKVTFSKNEEFKLMGLLEEFDQFLVDKEHSYIQLEGEFLNGDLAVKRIPLTYSCDPSYRNLQMARLYRLNDWYNSLVPSKRVLTMMTLTTYQRCFKNYFDQYGFLRDSWLKLKDVMKKELGQFEYIVVAEPHKTGFAHYHVLIFKWINKDQVKRFMGIWAEKYEAGSWGNGLDFKVSLQGALRSVKNYLMKYLAKTFTLKYDERYEAYLPDSDLKRFSDSPSNAVLSATDELFFLKIFHAVKWKMNKRDSAYRGFRAFQPSRALSKIMSLPRVENVSVAWHSVYLVIWGETHLVRVVDSPLKKYVLRVGESISDPPGSLSFVSE